MTQRSERRILEYFTPMSVKREELEAFFRETFADMKDYTHNGVQVEGGSEIKKMLFSVSLTQPLIDRAIAQGYDAIFVHHGFFGKQFISVAGPLKEKLKKLLLNDVTVFGYHLPLDAHAEYGNNALLCQGAGLRAEEPLECGWMCSNPDGLTLEQISERLGKFLPAGYTRSVSAENNNSPFVPKTINNNYLYKYGRDVPQKVFICSGGAGEFTQTAIDAGADLFILGEAAEYIPSEALDGRMSLLLLGHWRSEIVGARKMAEVVHEKFGIETHFVVDGVENVL